MIELLAIFHNSKVEECEKHFGAHIGFSWLKEIIEEHLTKETNLENISGREEDRDNHRTWCVQVDCNLTIYFWISL